MIDNLPEIVETLRSHISQLSHQRMMRPSGSYRKHQGTDEVVPSGPAVRCIQQMRVARAVRLLHHWNLTDEAEIAVVSGYVFAKTNSVSEVLATWNKEDMLAGYGDIDLNDIQVAAATIRDITARENETHDNALAFNGWTIGFKLAGYLTDMSADADAFLKEITQ